jgi:hypothetical protein
MAAVLALVGLDGGSDADASPVEIRWIELDVSPSALALVGDVLLANGREDDAPTDDRTAWWRLLRSTDLGATWTSVTLPGAPPDVAYLLSGPEEVGGGVAVVRGVVGTGEAGPTAGGDLAALWETTDGTTWSGGPLIAGDGPPPGENVLVQSVDGVLLAAVDTRVFRSVDLGRSWTTATVPDLPPVADAPTAITEFGSTADGRLIAVLAGSGGLSLAPAPVGADALVSDDGGVTWRLGSCRAEVPAEPQAEPPGQDVCGRVPPPVDLPGAPGPLSLEAAVPLADGGRLAVAALDAPGDGDREYLVASDDRGRWRDISPESRCATDEVQDDPEIILPSASFSGPLPFAGRWLVVHRCAGENAPVETELVLVDPAGTEAVPVPGTRRDAASYGSPVVVGDTVVMLEFAASAAEAVLQVRPSDGGYTASR